jgi:hypothetical protein
VRLDWNPWDPLISEQVLHQNISLDRNWTSEGNSFDRATGQLFPSSRARGARSGGAPCVRSLLLTVFSL